MFTSSNEDQQKDCYVIGVDVGGTNTDAVLLLNDKIIYSHKTTTTSNVSDGIQAAISGLLQTCDPRKIKQVMVGTTHLLNALLQRQVERVGIIRLAKPATNAIPPLTGWPEDLTQAINGFTRIVSGGFEYNGQEIASINKDELENIARETIEKNIKYIAITGVYSHVNPSQEIAAARILKRINPDLVVSFSHEREGELLERENATIIDAALKKVFYIVCEGIQSVLQVCGIEQATLYLSHNDGTLSPVTKNATDIQPIMMLKSGPTNSLRGASVLIKETVASTHCIIADIGGTSTDVGILVNGEPAEKNSLFELAGVRLKFPSTQVQSISLGGGSKITVLNNEVSVGKSIANRLATDSICFGGSVLTTTDIAAAKGRINPKGIALEKIQQLSNDLIEKSDHAMHIKFSNFISEMLASVENKPETLVLVGGGAALFDSNILLKLLENKISTILTPKHSSVANATGAATAEISGTHIEIYDLQKVKREDAYADAESKAIKQARSKGANVSSIHLKNKEAVEIRYVVGKPTQIRVKVAGRIAVNPPQPSIEETQDISKKEKLLQPDVAANAQQFEQNTESFSGTIKSDIAVTAEINQYLQNVLPLTIHDITKRSIGHAFLGSGGGGDTRLSEIIVKESIRNGKVIKVLPLEKLPDDATVICFGLMGSPSVFEEKIPSNEEIRNSVLVMQNKLGKKIDAIVVMEGGGTNGVLPYFAAAELGLPIVNADTMGRAFPGINMVTPTIYNGVKHHIAALANVRKVELVEADNANELEDKARLVADSMGGAVYISYLPMDGKTAKKYCIAETLTIAHQIGENFLLAKEHQQNPLTCLNQYLKNTEYEEAKEVFKGRIDDLRRTEERGFSIGGILINDGDRSVEVVFQNENLLAREKLTNGSYRKLAEVPDLITVVDQETYEPISTPQLSYGQKVRLLTLHAPKLLTTEKALAIVGPHAYGMLERTDEASPLICNSLFSSSKQRTGICAAPLKSLPNEKNMASSFK